MAIAIYYNGFELEILSQVLVEASNDSNLTGAQRNFARNILNNGLSAWPSAPIETGPRATGDVDCRRVVINFSGTLQQVVDYLTGRHFVVEGDDGNRYPANLAKDLLRGGGEQL